MTYNYFYFPNRYWPKVALPVHYWPGATIVPAVIVPIGGGKHPINLLPEQVEQYPFQYSEIDIRNQEVLAIVMTIILDTSNRHM